MLRGNKVRDSNLVFLKGVNLITGGSDSGKTFAYELINFAFGAGEVPNQIEESKGYNFVYLEIIISNIIHTIIRTFDNPSIIKIYSCDIDGINEQTLYDEFQASGKAKKSISSFFMKKLGYSNNLYLKKLKTKDDIMQLTIRSYLKSFMISEEKITAKSKSIIETELTYPHETFTREKFEYFLTKTGNKEKIKVDKCSSTRATNKLEILQELLSENKKKIKDSQFEMDNNKIHNFDRLSLDELSKKIKKFEDDISDKKDEILQNENKILSITEEKNKVEQTMNRFSTLAKQYGIEMDRLDFIYEGESYLKQITKAICPLCHSELEEKGYDLEKIYKSFNAEKCKVAKKNVDIKCAISDMKLNNKELYDKGNEIEIIIKQLQSHVDNNLIPNLRELRVNYDDYLKYNEIQTKIEVYELEITNLEAKIETYEGMIDNKKESKEIKSDDTLYLNRRKELCKKMKELLEKFRFSESIEVDFDDKAMDFLVNNQKRKAYGQGYSSLVYIVFVLSLKWIMDKYDIPTPNFVIFDSPFTSLTEGDEIKEKKVLESNEMVDAFFDFVTKEYKDKQLILFENSKEKYEQVNKQVHYTHFTKNNKFGRYGFIIK